MGISLDMSDVDKLTEAQLQLLDHLRVRGQRAPAQMKKDDHAAAPLASLERGDAVSEEAVASNLQAAAAQEAQVTPVLEAGAQVAAASQDGRQRKPAKKRSGSGCQSTRARSRGQCSTAMPPSVPAPLWA
mmetsp:Transcript_24925/g.68360  ORF Transcript_24925/g.68360 Transcript_24925/m.68360 type:complete len:130 (-) Transcript_24925:425-814(-)